MLLKPLFELLFSKIDMVAIELCVYSDNEHSLDGLIPVPFVSLADNIELQLRIQ